jgi:hypothetical protein
VACFASGRFYYSRSFYRRRRYHQFKAEKVNGNLL